MARNEVDQLFRRVMASKAFRAAVQEDPDAALASARIHLTAFEYNELLNVNWQLSDEELTEKYQGPHRPS
jgi:hypothetical protein